MKVKCLAKTITSKYPSFSLRVQLKQGSGGSSDYPTSQAPGDGDFKSGASHGLAGRNYHKKVYTRIIISTTEEK